MTERMTAKKKRLEEPKAPKKPAVLPIDGGAAADGASEIERLRADLAAAHARIAELEQKHTEIINRIDWVIDSLHNLAD